MSVWPKPGTDNWKVLQVLRRGPATSEELYFTTRAMVHSRVADLRKHGYVIENEHREPYTYTLVSSPGAGGSTLANAGGEPHRDGTPPALSTPPLAACEAAPAGPSLPAGAATLQELAHASRATPTLSGASPEGNDGGSWADTLFELPRAYDRDAA